MPGVDQVEVVLANSDRVTLRVGDVFLKIDADQGRADVEVEAMALAPVPTPEVLWRKPPALALAAVRGKALGPHAHAHDHDHADSLAAAAPHPAAPASRQGGATARAAGDVPARRARPLHGARDGRRAARKLHLKPRRRARTFTLGSTRRTLARAGSARLRIKPSRKIARALKRARSLRVTFTVTARYADGQTRRQTVHKTLRR